MCSRLLKAIPNNNTPWMERSQINFDTLSERKKYTRVAANRTMSTITIINPIK
jgi:hypothetical protein